MVRRAILLALNNEGGLAKGQLELTADEVVDGVEMLSWPGISIRPGPGCESIVLAVGGNPSNLIAIPNQRGQRLAGEDLETGEVALNIGNANHMVKLKNDGTVLLKSGTEGATITMKPSGDVVVEVPTGKKIFHGVDGAVHPMALGDSTDAQIAELTAKFNAHRHIAGTFLLDGMGAPCTGFTGPSNNSASTSTVASDTIYGVS